MKIAIKQCFMFSCFLASKDKYRFSVKDEDKIHKCHNYSIKYTNITISVQLLHKYLIYN